MRANTLTASVILFCIVAGTPRTLAQAGRVAQIPVGIPNGGRATAITVHPTDFNVVVAAAFSGGLFKSQDAGHSWTHIDSFIPNRVSDVQFNPVNGNELVASVSFDSHRNDFTGIWISRDSGTTWQHSPLAPCAGHPAFGHHVSYGPGPNIFVGTDCGLAASHDDGLHFSVLLSGASIGSVVTQAGSDFATNSNAVAVDACDGSGVPQHSDNNGASFSSLPLPGRAACISIAQSPSEANILLALASSGDLFEKDGLGPWAQVAHVSGSDRPPWIRAGPQYRGPGFQIYVHNGADLLVGNCSGPRDTPRCTTLTPFAAFPFGAHHDFGGMAVPPSSCRVFVVGDGGVEASVGCAGPPFQESNAGFNALQIYRIAGTVHPDHTDLYIGTQDNGAWASPDGGLTWENPIFFDTFHIEAPHSSSGPGEPVTGVNGTPFQPFKAQADLVNHAVMPLPPKSDQFPDFYLVGGGDQGTPWYIHTDDGCDQPSTAPCLLFTGDTNGNWTQQAPALPFKMPFQTRRLYIVGPPSDPTVYATTNKAGGVGGLSRITHVKQSPMTIQSADTGLGNLAAWTPDDNPSVIPRVVGVDPNDPQHVIAADFSIDKMVVSTNAGNTWTPDDQLTNLVTDNGNLLFNEPFVGCQAHAIAFDPSNGQRIFVGTEANGVIATLNGGQKWFQVPGSAQMSAVSDFFFDEVRGQVWVSTYGRGLWVIGGLTLPTTLSVHATILSATPTMHSTMVAVKDALTGLGVAGASVTVRDNRTGATKAVASTDVNGIASLHYTVCTAPSFPPTNPPHIVPCAGTVFSSGYAPAGFGAP